MSPRVSESNIRNGFLYVGCTQFKMNLILMGVASSGSLGSEGVGVSCGGVWTERCESSSPRAVSTLYHWYGSVCSHWKEQQGRKPHITVFCVLCAISFIDRNRIKTELKFCFACVRSLMINVYCMNISLMILYVIFTYLSCFRYND